jgi:hypothetical protein
MFNKTHMTGGSGFSGTGAPLLPAAIGLGYLKQPLRYLTSDDIKAIGNRTIPRPGTTSQVNNIPTTPQKKLGSTTASIFGRNKQA